MFPEIKAGGWGLQEPLTSAQMNLLNSLLPKAIDGEGGGTYTLTAPLILKGDLVTIENLNPVRTPEVVPVSSSDISTRFSESPGVTIDLSNGSYHRLDGSSLDGTKVGWLKVQLTGTPIDGQEIILEVRQSDNQHGVIRWMQWSIGPVSERTERPNSASAVDPRTGFSTRFHVVWNEADGVWSTVSQQTSFASQAVDFETVRSTGFADFIRSDGANTTLRTTPKAWESLVQPMSFQMRPITGGVYPVSNIVYSPSTRAIWAVCRGVVGADKYLCWSFDGLSFWVGRALDSVHDAANTCMIAIIYNVTKGATVSPGQKKTDQVYVTSKGFGLTDQDETYYVEQGDSDNNWGRPLITGAPGAETGGNFAYRRIGSCGHRFLLAHESRLTAVNRGTGVSSIEIGEGVADFAVAPDRRCMAIATDGDIWFSGPVDQSSQDLNFTEVNTSLPSQPIGLAYNAATDEWVAVFNFGEIYVSRNDGSVWFQVLDGALTISSTDLMLLQGIGGGIFAGSGWGNSNELLGFTLDPGYDGAWFKQPLNLAAISAGGAWCNGRLVFPCEWTAGTGRPTVVISEPCGDLGPFDFDKNVGY